MDSHLSFPDWLHSQIYFPPLFILFLFILLFHSFPPFLEYSAPFHHISSIFAFPTAFPAAPCFPSRQSISELGLMLMLILISGLIFARFYKNNKYWREVKLFSSLCYFIEQEDESSNFTSIPTGIYWVRKCLKMKKKNKAIPNGIYWVRTCLKIRTEGNYMVARHIGEKCKTVWNCYSSTN